ncbi:cytochrome P450 [Kitasatospora sp. MAP5-34]|uniref:cytochrome P450 n=1 Tax=Kitasatospora sp. MAP5-34 TaxID=3035102 RepID=UPI002474956E|nr:cytochrome P450 [Kitasatospora sp. MAP5-34]MDH6574556.1 cytochrome P450 [Kitasatospora sp. MAP5-34]
MTSPDTDTAVPRTTDPGPTLVLPAEADGCPFDPPSAYRQAADHAPVTRTELWDGSSCWLVTGHQEVRAVLADQRFSADGRTPGFPFLTPGRRELANRTPAFIRMDDPEHARLRRMLTTEFLVKRVEDLRPALQRIVDDTLDRMVAGGGPADLVTEFALPIPSLAICLLLGVPYEDHEHFQRQSSILLDITAAEEQVAGAQRELRSYLAALTADKRRAPTDDILSRLAVREDLTTDEAASTALLLLVAGHETTANMTALSTLALLRNPAQAARLRSGPAEAKVAVEELLRYLTIVQLGLPRAATEDLELGGTLIRKGDGLLCMLSTANRDESVFPGGSDLDLDRDARRHLAFGFGVHQCLGQPLARAELQIALRTLFTRLPDLRLAVDEDQLSYRTTMVVHGVHSLPVAW